MENTTTKKLYIVPQRSGFGTSTFFGTNPPEGVIPITQEQLEALKNYDLCWQNGRLIEYTGEKPVKPTYEREEYASDSPEDKEIIRLIRKRYTLSKELKIQRERFSKPEVFAEYDLFVKDCISQVDEEFSSNPLDN